MCPHHTLETCSSELWRTLCKLGSQRAETRGWTSGSSHCSVSRLGFPEQCCGPLLLFQARSPERRPQAEWLACSGPWPLSAFPGLPCPAGRRLPSPARVWSGELAPAPGRCRAAHGDGLLLGSLPTPAPSASAFRCRVSGFSAFLPPPTRNPIPSRALPHRTSCPADWGVAPHQAVGLEPSRTPSMVGFVPAVDCSHL